MKVALHIVKERRARLAQLLREHKYLPVAEVCARLGISEATARRDLAALAEEHAITRTRGGAIYEFNERFPSFTDRMGRHPESKARIAAAALPLLSADQTIWLDSGTTCQAIAQAIASLSPETLPANLTVVTNNLPAADLLGDNPNLAVHLSGVVIFADRPSWWRARRWMI